MFPRFICEHLVAMVTWPRGGERLIDRVSIGRLYILSTLFSLVEVNMFTGWPMNAKKNENISNLV